ncbi:serine protease 56 [Tiliqua scincoides]|uniref:serine protease 56 n=1 Tax=Tiliqua scincoides TaxID=71010 RepID=UPI003461F0C4
MNSVVLLLVTCLVEPAVAAPLGKEQYAMPPSVLQALSSRGTLVLESAMKNALQSLEEALSEHARRLQECEECVLCLFGDCGNWTRECAWLERDMGYLNTVADQAVQGLCGHRIVLAPNETVVKGKIVGGSKAWHGAWPWLVSVRLNGELMCGGVLVGDAWVLTAAHCFTGSSNELAWSVVLGDYDLTKPDEGEQAVPVSRVLPHPKFNSKTFHNDVALLELSSPVAPSTWVAPVCLPEQPAELSTGTPCYIIGWGSLYEDGPAADVVMEARVPVLAQDICRSVLGRQLFTNTMFCAGYLSGGVDSCQGDSGGPLTCWEPLSEQYVLYGITSWGDGCGERGKPGVYTRVTAFTDWIHQQMEKSPSSHEPTCFELLALAQMPPERQQVELNHLCAFYTQLCSLAASPVVCGLMAEEKCKMKRQQCELRSYAQTLLEFLHRAEEFFRTQINFSFLTRSLPQFMQQVYRHLFPAEAHQDSTEQIADTEAVIPREEGMQQPHARKMQKRQAQASHRWSPSSTFPSFASLFQGTGPSLGDWVQALKAMAEGSRMGTGGEEQLFLQHTENEVEELQDQGQAFIQQLWRSLDPQGALLDLGPEQAAASMTPTLVLNDSLAGKAHDQREKRSLGADPVNDENHTLPKGSGCQGVNESVQHARDVRELHSWILRVPERDLAMTFQEVLVDLGSKNAKGLYQARIRVTVGHKATAFMGLIGLANDSLYRSMPGLIARALESLKT